MIRFLSTISLCGFLIFGSFPALSQSKNFTNRLDSIYRSLYSQQQFNGVVLYAEKGKPLYQEAFGVVDYRTGEPLQMSSAFNLASVSKQFLGMMAMMLHESGKLNYDGYVTAFLPSFPYPDITVRHLLTHTSGLVEYFEYAHQNTISTDTLTNEGVLQLLRTHKPALEFTPGEKWAYCNTGYLMLALVLEKAAGRPLQDFFAEKITGPLGMRNTYAFHLQMGINPKNRVFGFEQVNGKDRLNDLYRFDGVLGDGNCYASAQDLLLWDQALYTSKLVRKETLAEGLSPVKLNDGTTYPYGFGWFIEEPGKMYSHTGGWVGFVNVILRDIEHNRTLIVLSSGSNGYGVSNAINLFKGDPIQMPSLKLIRNVQVIDGSGAPARPAAVRLRNNRIEAVGDLSPLPGEEVYDGQGQVLAPGFIDTHSHHDGDLEEDPGVLAAVSQGITTICVGQDGGSRPMDTIAARLERQPIALNLASYTGHASLRVRAMGFAGVFRQSTATELDSMKILLEQDMAAGSLGLSSGLEYERGFYATPTEVIELAKVVAAQGGRYISHIRSEDINLTDALEEIILIGREAKLPVQISHFKIADRSKWGRAGEYLARLQAARAEGIDISADVYPYDYWQSTLRVLFPKKDFDQLSGAQFAVDNLCDPDGSVLLAFAPKPEYAGLTLSAVAQRRGETAAQTLMWLVAEAARYDAENPDSDDRTEGIMGKSMAEEDIRTLLSWSHTNICSDGSGSGHPRGHGAFSRVLGRYVREQGIVSLPEAIRKMTALSAEHLGLRNRGMIAPGYYADLVLFDPNTIIDRATISQPRALSEGISTVWVNGEVVYDGAQATGKYPGKFLRRE